MDQNLSTSTEDTLISAKKSCKPHSRECPSCGLTTIHGMPGGRDATCLNCGYKDPCCYD
ncbi:hypothetical protein BH09PAT2_BH09PAT2_08840 [soil metagenome]